MDNVSLAFWIQTAIELIVFVCFLVLCNNVYKVKKKLIPNDNFNASFSMFLSIGDKESAKKILCEEICKHPAFILVFRNNGNNSDARRVIEAYFKPHMDALGLSFDFSKSDNFIKELEKNG